MISENIKNLRNKIGMTQKELAEKLYVTPQAVSRWENGEVEPSVDTITTMAQIFGVTTDEIIGGPDKKPEKETVVKTEYVKEYVAVPNAPQKPVLAVCEQCNKPIYNGAEIVRHHHSGGRGRSGYTTVLCKSCDEKNKKRAYDNAVANGLLQRKRSFLWGGLLTALAVAIALIATLSANFETGAIIGASIGALLFFPFLSCIFLKNNFIDDLFGGIASWSIKMPGLIFSLDLEGIIWLLTVKLALWILGGLLSIFCFLLAIAVCLALSVFVYPYAIVKNIKHPELTDVV